MSSETVDIATALTSVVSGGVAVWGFLNQNLAAAPIGFIVFTASLSYFFQRRMQEKDEAIVRARHDYPILEAEAQEILAVIEAEITRWAK